MSGKRKEFRKSKYYFCPILNIDSNKAYNDLFDIGLLSTCGDAYNRIMLGIPVTYGNSGDYKIKLPEYHNYDEYNGCIDYEN